MTTYKNRLPAFGALGYISPAPHKTGAGICPPLVITAHNRASVFFLRAKHRHAILFALWRGVWGSRKAGRVL